MGLFDKPEVTILKETSDAKDYLEKLETLRKEITDNTEFASKIDKEITITKAGIIGEESIMFELKNSGMDLVVLHDLYIETSDGRGAQIDYLVITPYVNVLIECKNLFGNIEINSKGEFIRSFQYNGHWIKEGIYSPITQNERHLTVFKNCRTENKNIFKRALADKSFETFNKSLVVLANPKTIVNDKYAPKEIRNKVIRGDQLINVLKGLKNEFKSSKKEMISYGNNYLALNRENRKEYIAKFQKFVDENNQALTETEEISNTESLKNDKSDSINQSSDDETLICPWCGKELVLRTAKKGTNTGNQFYGCSGFPKCRYIKNL